MKCQREKPNCHQGNMTMCSFNFAGIGAGIKPIINLKVFTISIDLLMNTCPCY